MHSDAAKRWFVKASRDLRTAKALIGLEDPDLELTAFVSQQCAEKSIKGFLTFHGKRFPKTHDLKDLADLVIKIDSTLEPSLAEAISLTPFAVKLRYPDATDIPDVTETLAKGAIQIAQSVYDLLVNKLE